VFFSQLWYGESISISLFGQCPKQDCETVENSVMQSEIIYAIIIANLFEIFYMLPEIQLEYGMRCFPQFDMPFPSTDNDY